MGDIIDTGLNLARKVPGISTIVGGDAGLAIDPVGGTLQHALGGPAVKAADATPAGAKTLLDPTQMPTIADQRTAKRKSIADQLARKGRASTILTNPDGLGASG